MKPALWVKRTGYLPAPNVQGNALLRFNHCSAQPAKLNGLNSAAWLKDMLEKLPVWPNSRIDELLSLTPNQIEAIKQKLPGRSSWQR